MKNNRPRNMGNCEMCYYWVNGSDSIRDTNYGICHRFPSMPATLKCAFCGEFVNKDVAVPTGYLTHGKKAYIGEKDQWPAYVSVVKAPDQMNEDCDEYDLEKRSYYMREECSDVSEYFDRWKCSECGAVLMMTCNDAGDPSLYIDGVAETPWFCPYCGREVRK